MEFRLTVVKTPHAVRAGVFRFWARFCGRDFLIALALSLITGFGWTVLGWHQWYVAATAGLSLLFIFGMLTLLVVSLYRGYKALREIEDPREHWTFDEDGLVQGSERGELAHAWSSVSRLWRYGDVWLLFLGGDDYSILPRKSMTPMVEAFISRKVSTAGGKVK